MAIVKYYVQFKRDGEKLERAQKGATKLVKDLEGTNTPLPRGGCERWPY